MLSLLDQPKVVPAEGRAVRLLDADKGGRPSTDLEHRAKVREYSERYARKHAAKIKLSHAKSKLRLRIRTAENRITRLQGDLQTWREQLAKLETVQS